MSDIILPVPDQLLDGASYHQALSPEFAMNLGKDVLHLSVLQTDAFFNPSITHDLASQPRSYQRIKKAWLSLDEPTSNDTVLSADLDQTRRLLDYADMVDETFGIETLNRYVLLFSPRAVLLPQQDFGVTTIGTELAGVGRLTYHDQENGTVTGEVEMTPGDIVVIDGSYMHSVANLSMSYSRVVLAQTLPTAKFTDRN